MTIAIDVGPSSTVPVTEPSPQPPVGSVGALLGRAARYSSFDAAVGFALAGRIWQLVGGPITLLVIARYFTPEVQGFYYTFGSLLALQSFVELGFYIVIINVASHEWSHLGFDADGRIAGDPDAASRLVSLGRLVFKWYAVASAVFVAVVSVAGYAFFARSGSQAVVWQTPWLMLVILTGAQLWVLPLTALLEGCNQVATVNRFRLFQAIAGSLALWVVVSLGGGLWAAVAMASARLLSDLTLLLVRYRTFFATFYRPPSGARLAWRTEIWPMQWRLGLSGVVNYFAFSLFNPVMFRYHGAAVAGQMGMTLQAVGGIQALALVWVSVRVPQFGMLIARRDYQALDRLWLRTSLSSVAIVTAGACAFLALVYGLNAMEWPIARRLLDPQATTLLLLAAVAMQVAQCLTAYMRAHKREPIVVMNVTTSLAIGASVWLFGRRFGPTGAAAAYLSVMTVLVVWESAIWRRFRRDATAAAVPAA